MSMQCFLATDKNIVDRSYLYKDILPTIKRGDMFYNGGISFDKRLTETEKATLGNFFDDFKAYAIRSEFKLGYEPELKDKISESFAKNALEELKWFKNFAKNILLKQDIFMVINLWLGHKTDYDKLQTRIIDINDWKPTLDEKFEFESGILYQFTDNSEEAVKARRARNL